MLISRNLHNKSGEVSIITRSPTASLSFKGQVTRHTTVKRFIGETGIKSNGTTNQMLVFVRGENQIESPQKNLLEQSSEATLPQPTYDTKPRIELGAHW